jgi:hypothetical protein
MHGHSFILALGFLLHSWCFGVLVSFFFVWHRSFSYSEFGFKKLWFLGALVALFWVYDSSFFLHPQYLLGIGHSSSLSFAIHELWSLSTLFVLLCGLWFSEQQFGSPKTLVKSWKLYPSLCDSMDYRDAREVHKILKRQKNPLNVV